MDKILMQVVKANQCPLYREGDTMEFVPPQVTGSTNAMVCGLAIGRFLPVLEKILKGKEASKFSGRSCDGCMGGEAWFEFRHFQLGETASAGTHGDVLAALRDSRLFAGLPDPVYKEILPLFVVKKMKPGDLICHEGEPTDGLYVVSSGRFDVLRERKGLKGPVASLGPGECIGEASALAGTPATATVRAATDAVVISAPREVMPRLLGAVPSLPTLITKLIASRLAATNSLLRKENEVAMRGQIGAIAPADLIQTVTGMGSTGTLVCEGNGRTIRVFFRDGKLIDAESDRAVGEEALYEFFGWSVGSFQFFHNLPAKAPRIRTDTTALLLEVLRRLDEKGAS